MMDAANKADEFVVRDSKTIMGTLLAVSIVFGGLFAWFVSPQEAGYVYWAILLMVALFATAFILRLAMARTHLIINKRGIYFTRTNNLIRWKNIARAGIIDLKEEIENEEDFRLMVYYHAPGSSQLQLASFKVSVIMDKSDGDIEQALQHYRAQAQ